MSPGIIIPRSSEKPRQSVTLKGKETEELRKDGSSIQEQFGDSSKENSGSLKYKLYGDPSIFQESLFDQLVNDGTLDNLTVVPRKIMLVFYGNKGTGKTLAALAFFGRILMIGMEKASLSIYLSKLISAKARERIVLADFSGMRLVTSEKEITKRGYMIYTQMHQLLQTLLDTDLRPDWIVLDGAGAWISELENAMRYVYGLGPQSTVPIGNWKQRKVYIQILISLMFNLARKGIIVTTHMRERRLKEISDKLGQAKDTNTSQGSLAGTASKSDSINNDEIVLETSITDNIMSEHGEPNWTAWIMEDSDALVFFKHAISSTTQKYNFVFDVPSNKVSGHVATMVNWTNNPRRVFDFFFRSDAPPPFSID